MIKAAMIKAAMIKAAMIKAAMGTVTGAIATGQSPQSNSHRAVEIGTGTRRNIKQYFCGCILPVLP